jgi:hypothetical protein
MSLKITSDLGEIMTRDRTRTTLEELNAIACLLWEDVKDEWPRDSNEQARHVDLLKLVLEYRGLMNELGRRLANRPVLNLRDYYKTENWKRLRDEALMRASRQCALCPRREGLQVHHRTYERAGREELDDLIVLCRNCHARHHEMVA